MLYYNVMYDGLRYVYSCIICVFVVNVSCLACTQIKRFCASVCAYPRSYRRRRRRRRRSEFDLSAHREICTYYTYGGNHG